MKRLILAAAFAAVSQSAFAETYYTYIPNNDGQGGMSMYSDNPRENHEREVQESYARSHDDNGNILYVPTE
jgi:hypothetical protein